MYELTVCTSAGMPLKRFDLSRLADGGPPITIGRAEDCDIRIRNTQISRRHCQIEAISREDWVLRDLGSTTGTYHHGLQVQQIEIESGLELQVGPALLRFESSRLKVAEELARELADVESEES